ncbi:hypothetical protein EDD18DRAFT_1108844 [Armillaria luteobubalina]|uniref:Uncharacterized protein n=1 Tax=Armillaria luteobubalina TaxID=153913 RepID=A0AA39PYP0_9AGAR|nr:hypothetical protein EDD18DRAFT_1108844 [Armillaria luteobubalina]
MNGSIPTSESPVTLDNNSFFSPAINSKDTPETLTLKWAIASEVGRASNRLLLDHVTLPRIKALDVRYMHVQEACQMLRMFDFPAFFNVKLHSLDDDVDGSEIFIEMMKYLPLKQLEELGLIHVKFPLGDFPDQDFMKSTTIAEESLPVLLQFVRRLIRGSQTPTGTVMTVAIAPHPTDSRPWLTKEALQQERYHVGWDKMGIEAFSNCNYRRTIFLPKRFHVNLFVATIRIANEDEDNIEKWIAVDLCKVTHLAHAQHLCLHQSLNYWASITLFNRMPTASTRIRPTRGTLAESVAEVEDEIERVWYLVDSFFAHLKALVDTSTNVKLIWACSFSRREGLESIVRSKHLPTIVVTWYAQSSSFPPPSHNP